MSTFAELTKSNEQYTTIFSDRYDTRVGALVEACRNAASTLGIEQIRQLRQTEDSDTLCTSIRDNIIPLLLQLFQSKESQYFPPLDIRLVPAYLDIATELFVLALRYDAIIAARKHPAPSLTSLIGRPYDLHLAFFRVEEAASKQQRESDDDKLQRDYWERRSTDRSVDSDKESKVHIAPAEKARILRNAISKLNEVGILITHNFGCSVFRQIEHDPFVLRKSDLHLAQTFFERNRRATVSEVVDVAELCARAGFEHPQSDKGRYDPIWHARQGTDIGFLLRNFAKAAEQVGYPLSFTPEPAARTAHGSKHR